MKLVFIIALVGLFGFAAVAFLLNKARGALAKEREAEKITLSNDERIRETANWLGAYVGYYEYDGGLFVFLDEMRVNESDTPIDKVYAALEEVGAGALVPPLQRMAAAYQ
ncbi:MAG: hypothetical protein SXU28_14565, partial [Pseudomonadota bacterium]|nr:hypothetical protein [Pseudomonadota bacterium]